MSDLTRARAEGLQFLGEYQSAFTTRSDGSTWPKNERTWQNATRYFRGLMRPGSTNTVVDIADKMTVNNERLERFVRESPWEHEAVETALRESVPEACQARDAAVIVDGMGIPKSGDDSVGVARQWCGATGKVDNCQVTVNCTLARPGERHNADQLTWPLGMRLFLSKQWADADDAEYDSFHERDRYAQRRQTAAIPEDVSYRPKQEIALELIDQAADADLTYGCVLADSNYGQYRSFREKLRSWKQPYILEMPLSKLRVIPEETELITPGAHHNRRHHAYPETVSSATPEEVAEALGDDDWTDVTWNNGTKGPHSGEFYRERIRVVERVDQRWVSEETGWLLLRNRSLDHDNDETDLTAWLCWDVDDASLDELVSWAQLRWCVEQFHRDIKQNLGADEYQGRTWKGIHHHLAVVMLAHAFVVRSRLDTGADRTDLSSFEEVISQIVLESAIQGLIEDKGCNRARAEELAEYMLRGYSPW